MKEFLDSMNRPRTSSLFLETVKWESKKAGYEPVYTLRPYEYKGLPSAYQIYMNSANEYEAAVNLVGNTRHWNKLSALNWFLEGNENGGWDGLRQWRLDKMAKDEAEALNLLRINAEKGNVSAQKALLDAAKKVGSVGRPKKEVLDPKAAEQQAQVLDLLTHIQAKRAAEESDK